jgi:hypothetical protein
MDGNGFGEMIGKAIGALILFVAVAAVATVGVGALGGYFLAAALGAGKGLAITAAVAGGIAGPFAAGGVYSAKKNWDKRRRDKEWKKQRASYSFNPPVVQPAPQPAPVPAVQPAPVASPDETPPVFVDALSKMKELPPDERRKYFDRLRDAFPNEVESLGGFNEQMALAHEAPTMKKLTLVKKPEPLA